MTVKDNLQCHALHHSTALTFTGEQLWWQTVPDTTSVMYTVQVSLRVKPGSNGLPN